MTSNLGADVLSSSKEPTSTLRPLVMEVVRRHFLPEFLNRIDEIVLFNRLTRENMGAIVKVQLQEVDKLLKEKNITLKVDAQAQNWLAEMGFDEAYGARPLKRVIQQHILNPMSRKLLSGEILEKATVDVGLKPSGQELAFKIINETEPTEEK